MKKRFALLTLLLMIGLSVWATENEPYVVYNDGTLTFYYDGLRSSRTGTTYDLNTGFHDPEWLEHKETITKAVFDVSFASARPVSTQSWFAECRSMIEIEGIENLNTSHVTRMPAMFLKCYSLTNLDVSGFDTRNVENMYWMFWGCSSLTALDVSKFETKKVVNMSAMFWECSKLLKLDVSGFDTKNVTEMDKMFDNCSSLISLDVSGFITKNVTNMSNMFSGCSNLTSLDVSRFDTRNVTTMFGMFSGCSNLISLDVSGFDTQNVTRMDYMFSGCSNLTNLDVSGFDTKNVTEMENMFRKCSNLTSLDISNFNTASATALSNMFSSCANLTNLFLGSLFTSDKSTKVEDVFKGCSNLSKVLFNGDIPTSINAEFFKNVGTSSALATLEVPEQYKANYQAKFDGDLFYGGYFTLGTVKNGDTFTVLTKEGVEMTFKILSIEDKTCQVGSGQEASVEVNTPGQVTIPSIANGYNVIAIGDKGFYNCSELTHIWIHEGIEYIGELAFYGCTSLRVLDIPHSIIRIADDAFTNCPNVAISIPFDKVDLLPSSSGESTNVSVSIKEPSQEVKDDLERIFIPWPVQSIGERTFSNCSSVKIIEVDTKNVVFDSRGNCNAIIRTADNTLLYGCQNTLISETVTAIGQYAFEGHSKLQNICIPAGVVRIGESAFSGCAALMSVTSGIVSPFDINDNTFDEDTYKTATLNVPNGTKTLYQAAEGWKNFLNIVEAKDAGQDEDEIVKDNYVIGNPDYSSGWWTGFSKTYVIPDGEKFVAEFDLHIDPSTNKYYRNFALIITNDEDLGSHSYREYGAMRYDYADPEKYNSQWGDFIDHQYMSSTLQFYPDYDDCDPNLQKLEGRVKLIVDRSNSNFYVEISNGIVTKTYNQPYAMPNLNVDANNTNIRCFLVVENSYIEFLGSSNIEPIEGFDNSDTPKPYAVYNEGTLTFYNDNQRSSRQGVTYDLNKGEEEPGWYENRGSVTKAIFDSSFASARPTTGHEWFDGCISLSEIEGLEYLNTSEMTLMDEMFFSCSNLNSVDLSHFNTSKVTDMRAMFSLCSGLKSIDLSHFDTQNVENMGAMLNGCSSLTEINLSNFDTSKARSINFIFRECTNLKEVTLGQKFVSSGNVWVDGEFDGCTNIMTVKFTGDIPVSINSKFFEGVGTADNPVTLSVPELYRTNYQAKFDGNKFYGGYFTLIGDEVSELKDGDIFTANTVEGVEMTFKVISAKDKIVQVGTGDGNTSAVDKDYAGTLTIPKEINGYKVDEIASHAFSYCNFSEIVLPSGLTYIDTEAFYLCESLKSIRIPSSLQNMSVVAFVSCTSVESIVVDEGNEYFDSREGCNAIIRKDDKTLIRGCKNSFIPSGVERINFAAFQQTPLVGSFVIPEGVTYIGQSAFVSATMSSISLPSTLTYIGGLSFQNCNGIESVAIPEGVTYIGNYAFSFCDKLNRVTIPASVTEIGEKAFIGSTQLKTIVSYLTEPCAIADNVFMVNDLDDGNNSLINATLYVPFGSKTIYENTDGWKNFKNIVELNATVGDVTGDGEVTKEDITEVETEILEPSAVFDPNKDVNRDGVVNVADIVEGNNIRNSQ